MKFLFFTSLVITLVVTFCHGAVVHGVYNNPKHPGKCFISDKLILSPGESAKDPEQDCARITCFGNSQAETATCGVMHVEGFTFGDYIDKSRNYPDCCEKHLIKA